MDIFSIERYTSLPGQVRRSALPGSEVTACQVRHPRWRPGLPSLNQSAVSNRPKAGPPFPNDENYGGRQDTLQFF